MRAAFLTLGCKVNFYETEKMMADFECHGFDVVSFNEQADVYVINTCTVTNIADRKSRQMIHKAKKKAPDSLVVAVGCYVESGGEELLRDFAVDVAFSNHEKENVAEKVLAVLMPEGRQNEDDGKVDTSVLEKERTRKYIKIQDGCNQFCSYCMIPYVRGGGVLKSRDEEDVIEEIQRVADAGCKEVVLTGIHLSSYGVDCSKEKQFVHLKGLPLAGLLHKIEEISGIERIRLGSLEPRIICREFMDELQKITKLCPHFHLSLQSGSDSVLQRMNRHYTAVEYKKRCEMLREYYEHPAITTDVIVGFPGETQEEFEATKAFVREIGFADVHVFPYSIRSGTKAAKMESQIAPNIKHQRSEELMSEVLRGKCEYKKWFVGREERVLFEEMRERDGVKYLIGHNERYVLLGISEDEASKKGFCENGIAQILISEENLF